VKDEESKMKREELVDYLDEILRVAQIADYGPQGLQVESDRTTVARVALSVDVSLPIIERAAAWGADMLLAHHGVLWRSVEPIAGPLGARVRGLLTHGINLYAAHLPLDAHPRYGNNAVLATRLGVTIESWWAEVNGTPLGVAGSLETPLSMARLTARVNKLLGTETRVLAHGPEMVARLAILSGFGADKVDEAARIGVDAYLTGETSHANFWAAADHGLNVLFAGHYATETVGVQALGAHLAEQFGLEVRFLDFPTGM
jgi:dinuclear metal center YbgI/SA1388 family protein